MMRTTAGRSAPHTRASRALAFIAIAFGAVTLLAGIRVLSGADPGYLVYRPLLSFNTVMGAAYVAAGLTAWRNVAVGARASMVITALNLLVLAAIGYLFATGGPVAVDSVRAMTFRAGVWLLLTAGLGWIARARR
jgi:hypothetical protein